MKWARIIDNIAVELTDIDPAGRYHPDLVWQEVSDDCTAGARWDGQAWVDAPVPAPEPEPGPPVEPPAPDRHITTLAFLDRFKDAEAIAIDLASIGATPQAASMRRYLNKVNAATFIDLDRPDTRAGVEQLEVAGLLPDGRAAEILDAPIQPHERPRG